MRRRAKGTNSSAFRAANAPSRLPADADDTLLLNTIASVITHDLQLPLPAAVPAVAYADEASFSAGLERRGVSSERALEAARLSSAVANGAGIFLRSDLLRGMSTSERSRLFAHELAHVAQRRLGAGLGTPMWLREGHADWAPIGRQRAAAIHRRSRSPCRPRRSMRSRRGSRRDLGD